MLYIYVEPGTYNENIVFQDMTIRIVCSDADNHAIFTNQIDLSRNTNLFMQNIDVLSTTDYSVRTLNGSYIFCRDCILSSNANSIYFNGGRGFIQSCTISNSSPTAASIYAISGSTVKLYQCTINSTVAARSRSLSEIIDYGTTTTGSFISDSGGLIENRT